MSKFIYNHYIRSIILLGVILFTIPTLCANLSPVDKLINDSYNGLKDVQKQLQAIAKNAYINEPATTSSDISEKQLSAYLLKSKDIRSQIAKANDFGSINSAQATKLQALFTVSSYLDYINNKTHAFLVAKDRSEKYELLNSIFIANSLIDQIFSYAFK